MNEKKYILTDETIVIDNHMLHRIQAVKDFGCVRVGVLGGFIEKEENLSHEGICWVSESARVYDRARVYGKALVCGEASVYDKARVCGKAEVCDKARVYGEALVCGEARVYGEALVCDEAQVYGEARVYGKALVCGEARVCDEALIAKQYDILCISNIGSRKDTTTFFKGMHNVILVNCGCFGGTIEEFEKAVENTHGDNEHGRVYRAAIQLVKTVLA